MPKKKPEPVKAKEHEARKPVVQKAIADTSGSNLDDFKNVAKSVGTGINNFIKPGGTLTKFNREVTGFNDLTRFAKKPSIANAGGVALSAVQYLGGAPASAIARGAGNTARYTARILPDEVGRVVTKVLRLGNNEGRLTTVGNNVQNIYGRSVATERVVSPTKIAAGQAFARSNQVRMETQGILKGMAAANVIRQTEKISNKKDTKKK
jgi:hypothetical protein